MKLKVLSKKINSEIGQTMIEFLIVYFFLFLCFVSVIEISRLLAFKNSLQAVTSYIAHKIAYSQIDLLNKGILNSEKLNHACDSINHNAQYLSQTIEDFKNFIKGERVQVVFNLKENIGMHLVNDGNYVVNKAVLKVWEPLVESRRTMGLDTLWANIRMEFMPYLQHSPSSFPPQH